MSVIIDKEVDLNQVDLLTTKVYADTLKDLILNAPENEPLTIGLFGRWGSGKSSIINTLKQEIGAPATIEEITKNKPVQEKETPVSSKIGFVIYDAWKYANDSFRRTFILTLQQSLKVEEASGMKNFYKSNSTETSITIKPNTPFLILSLLFFLAAIFRFYANPSPTADWPIAAIAGILSYTTGILSKMFLELKNAVQTPVMSAPELFEQCFNDLIKSALAPVIIKKGWFKKDEQKEAVFNKIVIVIDNIDRCSKESAYELLTNTKNFINSNYQVVFLLPMDDDALKKHLFKSDAVAGDQAEEFLRKYFNVVVRMKDFRNTEIFDFANNINEKNELGLERDTVNIIAREYAKNPRRIIQFYNNLTNELKMMTLKHSKAFSKSHEAAICKFLIIREEWPEKYKSICSHPRVFLELDPSNLIEAKEYDGLDVVSPDSYEKFLDSTYVSTRNLKLNDLLKILLNADNYETFPESLEMAAEKGDLKEIKAALISENYTKDRALNHLLFKLKSALENELYDTDVSNTLNQLMGFLLAHPGTDKTYIERIESTTARKMYKIIASAKSFERLVKFNQLAMKKKLTFIDQHIFAHFKGFDPRPEDEFEDSDFQLYHNYLVVADEIQSKKAAGFFPRFLKGKKWDEMILMDLQSGQFDILYDEGVLSEIFFDPAVPVWLDQNYDHWVSLLGKLKNLKSFITLLVGNAGRSLERNPNDAHLFIKKYRNLFKLIPSEFEDPDTIQLLHTINDRIFITIPPKNSFMEDLHIESRPEVFKYLLESFRFTKGSQSSAGWIIEFFRIATLPPYAQSLASFISQYKDSLDFSQLKSLATSVQYIDEGIHDLQMAMIYLKVKGEPLFSDAEINMVLDELTANLSNYEEYEDYLKAHLGKSRTKDLMIAKLDLKNKEGHDEQPEVKLDKEQM